MLTFPSHLIGNMPKTRVSAQEGGERDAPSPLLVFAIDGYYVLNVYVV
jgi:hypothetical protein